MERAQVGTHVVSIGYRLRGAKCEGSTGDFGERMMNKLSVCRFLTWWEDVMGRQVSSGPTTRYALVVLVKQVGRRRIMRNLFSPPGLNRHHERSKTLFKITITSDSDPVKNPVDFGQTGAIPDQHVQIGMGRSSPSNSDQSEVASS